MRSRRIQLRHTMNRPGYADLIIDSIIYTVAHADMVKLAEDLVRWLATSEAAKQKEKTK